MLRRDHTLVLAMGLSLALHAGLLFIVAGQAASVRSLASRGASEALKAPSIVIDRPASPPPAELRFGDEIGHGDAANSTPGVDPLRAMHSYAAQAWLSRDPRGPGKISDEPSMSVLPRGGAPSAAEAVEPMKTPTVGLPDTTGNLKAPTLTHNNAAKAAPQPARQAPSKSNQPPGAPAPPADPAIQSDSESDPFSASSSTIDFNDGRVDARFGRKVRTVRPHLSLAAKVDLSSMLSPRMVVRLRIDSAGNVRKVDIVKSSGSDNADQAVRLALYQWWIEPKKDKSGKPVDDVVEFTIDWR